MLEKRVHMTKQQFMEYLGMVVRDDNATALRRACQSGIRLSTTRPALADTLWVHSPPVDRDDGLKSTTNCC